MTFICMPYYADDICIQDSNNDNMYADENNVKSVKGSNLTDLFWLYANSGLQKQNERLTQWYIEKKK